MAADPVARVPIPATVITGFLGSGKTTLLNAILTAEHGRRIAVIENEFGDIPIDAELVLTSEEQIFEMSNGCCLCCTARSDLIELLHKLLDRDVRLDRIVVETSGLADPNPVAQTFFVDERVASEIALDAIVTLVDAKHVGGHLDEAAADHDRSSVVEQIACADRLILNKVDLVATDEIAVLEQRVRTINATADMARSTHADVDLDWILGVGAFELSRTMAIDRDWLDESEHAHDPHLESTSLRFEGDLSADRFDRWLSDFLSLHGDELYRLKGILALENDHRRFILQGVHRIVDRRAADPWGREPRVNRLVFIGKGLDRADIESGLGTCVASAQ